MIQGRPALHEFESTLVDLLSFFYNHTFAAARYMLSAEP